MIASHYAEPLDRVVSRSAILREEPIDDGEAVLDLEPGEPFAMLDNSLGWAWGYAGKVRRVGYLRAESLAA